MKKLNLAIIAICAFTVSSCAQKNFKTLPSGLQYKIVEDKGATKSKVGDIVQLSFTMCYAVSDKTDKDSVLFSTSQKEVGPIQFALTPPQFHGDPMEGLTLLGKGDSAVFLTPYDSMMKNQRPSFVKPGNFMKMKVRVLDRMTKEEYDKKQKEDAEKQAKADDDIIQKYIADHHLTAKKTESGLYYVIEKQGDGPQATAGKKLSMNYTGMTTNGNEFDSNTDPKFHHVQPFEFTLGEGQVIKGWDEGVQLFNVGGKGKLLIPSGLGYGSRGAGANIPPNAVLIFDIEVVSQQ